MKRPSAVRRAWPRAARVSRSGATRGGAGAAEAAGDVGGGGLAGVGERLADGGDLLGEQARPVGLRGRGGGGLAEGELGRGGGGGGAAVGVLELGAQPADEALRLLGGALAVERDEAVEDRVVGEAGRPAVGAGGLGVDRVVELAEDADEAVVVDLAVAALDGLVGPELLQHVVHLGEGQAGMRRLLALAVGVEPLAEVAQAGAGGGVGVGEGKLSKQSEWL